MATRARRDAESGAKTSPPPAHDSPAEAEMALGVLWLIVGGTVLALFIARLGSSLPPDPGFRRQLAGWLALLALVSLVYSVWAIRAWRRGRSPMLAASPFDRPR